MTECPRCHSHLIWRIGTVKTKLPNKLKYRCRLCSIIFTVRMTETILPKLTKTARKQIIREALLTQTFNRDKLALKLCVKERSIRRYLNEIAKEEAEQNPELLHVLRSVCVKNLLGKAHKKRLSDKLQVAIVLSGETQKIEQHITEKVDVNVTRTEETLKRYKLIIERGQGNPLEPVQGNDTAKQIYPT